nr:ribonuclease H-like domain-containing protein [Tanacetum cinerariifolium]
MVFVIGSSDNSVLINSLDLDNPLHLLPNDFNANTIISVKLNGTQNYRVWATAMKLAINTKNKTGFIDGIKFLVGKVSYTSLLWLMTIPKKLGTMTVEIEALDRNNTWTITNLPKGRKSIGCNCIFKIKYKALGEIQRYKARLVAKCFNQREGIDYEETFSHVVKMTTIRCLIDIVVQNDWPLFQLDGCYLFLYDDLYDDLYEDVYMSLPLGCNGNNDNKSKYDYSLFVKGSGNTFMALLVYVYDMVITGSNVKQIDDFKQF